ncbi:MAG: GHKL domain-containing protein [Streptococcaceae bacterium]|nr:GHKL domain-containing protein [Streptococcaceae bacterium]
MKSKNINYHLEVKFPSNIDLTDNAIDLCAIIGNILDNAIEEMIQIKSVNPIKTKILYRDNKIVIQVANDTKTLALKNKEDSILSLKFVGRAGIGIKSVRMRTKKLGGYCDFFIANHEFNALIVIPYSPKE